MGSVWERQEEYISSVHSKNMKPALGEHILKKPSHKLNSDSVMIIDSEVRADQVSTDRGAMTFHQSTCSCSKEVRGATVQRWANPLEAEGVILFTRICHQ